MYSRLRKISKRQQVVWAVSIIILLVLVSVWLTNLNETFKESVTNIIVSFIASMITVLMIYISKWMFGAEDIEDQHDLDIARRTWNLLTAKKVEDSIINRLYNDEAATTVMRNSISYFTKRLATPYCEMISNIGTVLRENCCYTVKIERARDNNSYFISQHINYKRHFDIEKENIYMQCCFVFSVNELSSLYNSNTYFFREVIEDVELIDCLKAAAEKDDIRTIIRSLNFDMSLRGRNGAVVIESKNILMVSLRNIEGDIIGIELKYVISNDVSVEAISMNPFLYMSEDGKVSYIGQVRCKYPVPQTTHFLCVFPDPMIGNTRFNISFGNDVIKDVKTDVQMFPFITGPESTSQTIYPRDDHEVQFESFEPIFPTSGIVSYWKLS